jgi:hypothetical protein
MNSLIRVAALAASALSLTACATVTRGTSTAWEVKTTPPGASVKTTNGFSCASTPCSLKMPRKSMFTATISKEGYKSVDIQVTNTVKTGGGTAMAGNILIGGLIGGAVDVSSGAMLDLTPNPAEVTLEKTTETVAAK